MFRGLFKWLFRLLFLATLLLAGVAVHLVWFRPFSIDIFFDRVFYEYAIDDPQLLSSLRILEPLGFDFHNDELTELSVERTLAQQQKVVEDLATLRDYDYEALSASRQLSYDVLEYYLAMEAAGQVFAFHDYPVNQLFGVQSDLPDFMANIHQIQIKSDAENYLLRLNKFGLVFDQVIEGLRYRQDRGVVPPRFVVEKVLVQMHGFVDQPPRQNLLYTALKEKLAAVDKAVLDPVNKRRFLNRTETALNKSVYPAYRKLIVYYEELLPILTRNDGVWALPDGDAYYDYQVRRNTTTEVSAETIHQLGLSEVARIETEMNRLLEAEGYADGSTGKRLSGLCQEPRFQYPDSARSKQRIVADFQLIIDEISTGMEGYFDLRPKHPVEVKPVPVFKQDTVSGAYYQAPAMDGSRPGVFFINLREIRSICRFGMRTLAYHEATPGHHYQVAIQQDQEGLPMFRRVLPFTAFAEGWALYAERLAKELGFQEDPYDDLGRLQAEMFRAVRLVVDTGLHRKRWSREQAIDYMRDKTGMPEDQVVAEIERYLVNPGQALAYKMGMLKFLELRELARSGLGDKFNMQRFHDLVLTNGSLPLQLVEREIERFIAAEGS